MSCNLTEGRDSSWTQLEFNTEYLTAPEIGDGYLIGIELVENGYSADDFQVRVMDLQMLVHTWDGRRLRFLFPEIDDIYLNGFAGHNIMDNINLLDVDQLTPKFLKRTWKVRKFTVKQLTEYTVYWKRLSGFWLAATSGVSGFVICKSRPDQWSYKIERDRESISADDL